MPITISDLGASVLETHYAVRGPIVARAQELERSDREVIYCNIGNPQALGQRPLTYVRQVLSLVEWPELLEKAADAYPADLQALAAKILKSSRYGVGAYSESKGMRFVRDSVASFIAARDSWGGVRMQADPEHIFLTDGASKGVQTALRMLIADGRDGIMIPIPQYPLYSATITLYGGHQIGYYLDEKSGWSLERKMLEEAYLTAQGKGLRPKAICVINPGNPTGSVLSAQNIAMVIDFAREHNLSILADEVYQENIYGRTERFISFAHAMEELGEKTVSLFSFHSCSKGYFGECGQRGGYMEIRNVPPDVVAQVTKLQSVSLCANIPGQILVYLMTNPPRKGEASFDLFVEERDRILSELAGKAALLARGLDAIPGISCQAITGAMYAFPSVTLPSGRTDDEYCMALLENTGICVVPGSGFGQAEGTAHFRTTILPPRDRIEDVVRKIAEFHATWK
jgi:aspartate/methionine/tyrosine aminotransferase